MALTIRYLGHYKTLLKMKRDWVVCNDETVETLDDEEELRDLYEPSGYVYFYSRRYADSRCKVGCECVSTCSIKTRKMRLSWNHGRRRREHRRRSIGTQE